MVVLAERRIDDSGASILKKDFFGRERCQRITATTNRFIFCLKLLKLQDNAQAHYNNDYVPLFKTSFNTTGPPVATSEVGSSTCQDDAQRADEILQAE